LHSYILSGLSLFFFFWPLDEGWLGFLGVGIVVQPDLFCSSNVKAKNSRAMSDFR